MSGPEVRKYVDNNDTKKVKVSQKSRAKIFSCMRKTANFGRIYNYHRFDKHYFNPERVIEDIKTGSPKCSWLCK